MDISKVFVYKMYWNSIQSLCLDPNVCTEFFDYIFNSFKDDEYPFPPSTVYGLENLHLIKGILVLYVHL